MRHLRRPRLDGTREVLLLANKVTTQWRTKAAGPPGGIPRAPVTRGEKFFSSVAAGEFVAFVLNNNRFSFDVFGDYLSLYTDICDALYYMHTIEPAYNVPAYGDTKNVAYWFRRV